jgi:hypothetical protein
MVISIFRGRLHHPAWIANFQVFQRNNSNVNFANRSLYGS